MACKEPAKKTSSDIADEEIRLWQMCLEPLAANENLLIQLKRASSVIQLLCLLARKVLAVTATSVALERMFSIAKNINSKKRASLSCDHLEEVAHDV